MSRQRLLANNRNAIAQAVVTALGVRGSDAIIPGAVSKTGTGRVRLTGPYTGMADAAVELRIANETVGDDPYVSEPTYTGVGNGTLSIDSVTAATPAQVFTLKLVDLGTATEHASVPFFGQTIRSKTPGTAGDGITLSVDSSALTYADAGVLLGPISADTDSLRGPQWAFGGQPLNAAGELAAGTPRLVIGSRWPVYRQYRVFERGDWVYVLTPRPPVDLGEGSKVQAVSGTYTLTVTDGEDVETFPGLVTLYDALRAMRDRSEIVEVVGVVADDRTPGGQAGQELPLRTEAYALGAAANGSRYATSLEVGAVDPAAVTQLLDIECVDKSVIGGERWAVTSSATGALEQLARTGLEYAYGPARFTVPRKIPPSPQQDRVYIAATNFQRQSDVGAPGICLHKPIVGGARRSMTLRLVWTERPPEGCRCETAPMSGAPDPECLGLDKLEDSMASSMPDWMVRRWQALATYVSVFVAGNTVINGSYVRVAANDIALCRAAETELWACLRDLYEHPDSERERAVWVAETEYTLDQVRETTDRDGFLYRVSTPGESGSVEPTWDTTPGNTTADGTVVWTNIGPSPTVLWDELLADLETDLGPLEGINADNVGSVPALAQSTAYVVGDLVRSGSNLFKFLSAGTTTDSSQGDNVSGMQAIGDIGTVLADDGTSLNVRWVGRVDMANGDDLGVTAVTDSYDMTPAAFAERYRARCALIRASAGIPKSEASSAGGACWRDHGSAGYWSVNGGEYNHVENGIYWTTTKRRYNPETDETEIYSTYEAGFGVRVGCEDRLTFGDSMDIVVEAVGGVEGYQLGDRFTLPIQAADPLATAGGVDGDDTLTWRVHSSTAGDLPDYTLDLNALSSYVHASIGFTLTPGGIPWGLGDTYIWALGGNQFEWRYTGGDWSDPIDIAPTVALDDGLSAQFVPGPAPAFLTGDEWAWTVEQPYGPAALQQPRPGSGHAWTAGAQTINADLGSVKSIDMLAIALHTIPAGATIEIKGGDAAANEWTEVITWRADLMIKLVERTARYLQVALTDAPNASIGWWWAGQALTLTLPADRCTPYRGYIRDAGAGGLNPARQSRGAGRGVTLEWDEHLPQADIDALEAMADQLIGADEPAIVIPTVLVPAGAMLCRLDADRLEIPEARDYEHYDESTRFCGVALPFVPLYLP